MELAEQRLADLRELVHELKSERADWNTVAKRLALNSRNAPAGRGARAQRRASADTGKHRHGAGTFTGGRAACVVALAVVGLMFTTIAFFAGALTGWLTNRYNNKDRATLRPARRR